MDDCDTLILIVDDDDATREAFAILLSLEGYRVQTAADGLEALERLHAGERPALIVLDLMMPRMDGAQLRQRLARDEELAGIPILICTASGRARASRSLPPALAAGMLEKPVEPTHLVAAVRRVLSEQSVISDQ